MTAAAYPKRVVLVGPSGSGKSELAARLASRLGYTAVDTDALIEQRIGMPVFEFFGKFGEPAFRAIESDVLAEACAGDGVVVATGGGVVTVERNWTVMRPGASIVGLMAAPETLVARVNAQTAGGDASAVRPLLAGDPLQQIRKQLAVRTPLYAQADFTIQTDDLDPDEVAGIAMARIAGEDALPVPLVTLPGVVDRSDIYVGDGVASQAARLARQRWPKSQHVWIITDSNIGPLWAEQVSGTFEAGGYTSSVLTVPPGETSKSFRQVEQLCEAITASRANRRDLVVALGGGVVGDLAGLVASICLRGLSLIQIPTSLLAMVDSSVGGKTGINTPAGKNLVGTFNQPGLVLVDPTFLSTLPADEYRSGMAEVIKHSIIQPSTPRTGTSLREALAASGSLDPLDADAIVDVLAENVSIKYSVVQADERESGLRMILNFGHTTGHAIEADGYRYRHGEAVGLGMLVAGRIALELERVNRAWVDALETALNRAGLPTRLEGDISEIISRLSHDKKNVGGTQHWVLPSGDDGVEIVTGIEIGMVERALRDIGGSGSATGR